MRKYIKVKDPFFERKKQCYYCNRLYGINHDDYCDLCGSFNCLTIVMAKKVGLYKKLFGFFPIPVRFFYIGSNGKRIKIDRKYIK